MKTTTKVQEHSSLAETAGFKAAAANTKEQEVRARKLARAYEHFRYVPQEAIDTFNKRLYTQTMKREGRIPPAYGGIGWRYDTLKFTPVESYPNLPPADVLQRVAEAKAMEIFDVLEVAQIESVVVVPDPIVFGRINGCDDRFFIAQWGDDVSITDLIGDHEG